MLRNIIEKIKLVDFKLNNILLAGVKEDRKVLMHKYIHDNRIIEKYGYNEKTKTLFIGRDKWNIIIRILMK